jgi:hypothetical protein
MRFCSCTLKTLKSAGFNQNRMRSIVALTVLLALAAPSMALSPVEQAYIDGVKEGIKLGQLINNIDQYNMAVVQFNDHLNLTFGRNASEMWLPKMALLNNNNTLPDISAIGSLKPVHKIDGNPSEINAIQY